MYDLAGNPEDSFSHDAAHMFQPLRSGGKYEFLKDGFKRKLQIKNCNNKDEGKYTCKMLDKETTANLFVERKLMFFLLFLICSIVKVLHFQTPNMA